MQWQEVKWQEGFIAKSGISGYAFRILRIIRTTTWRWGYNRAAVLMMAWS
jgi:hypothetical protein